MNEEEIEAWYAKEKERITEEYKLKVKKGNNLTIEKHRPDFNKKLKALFADYNRRHETVMKRSALKKRLRKPIDRLQDKWHRFLKKFKRKE